MKTLKLSIVSFFFVIVTTVAQAADMRTVAVISVADLDTVVKTLKSVTDQAGYPDAMNQEEMILSVFEGYDTKQPIGIVIQADDENFAYYAFLPIPDVSDTALGMFLAAGEKQADGSVMLPPFQPMMPPIYVKQSGKWVYVSITQLPKTLPSNPVTLLDGMDKQYLIGMKANIANLPKSSVIGALGMARVMAELYAQTEGQYEAIGTFFEQIQVLLDELKTVSFGISVTPQNDIVIDSSAEAVAGSVTAADIAAMASFKTGQIGFYQQQDSIFAMIGAGILNEIIKKQYTTEMKIFFEGAREEIEAGDLDADGIAAVKSVLDNVEAMLYSTIKSGKIDVGITWKKNATLLIGATIADGNKLQKALNESLVTVPDEYQHYVMLNTEQFVGYNVSTIAVPTTVLPREGMSKALASRMMTLHIAIKDEAIALAFGLDEMVLTDLKKAITASKITANLPQTVAVITPGNLVDFLTLIGPRDDNQDYKQVMDIVKSFPPDGQITITDSYSGNTNKSKVVVSGKLLPGIGKFLGIGINAAQRAQQIMQEQRGGYY